MANDTPKSPEQSQLSYRHHIHSSEVGTDPTQIDFPREQTVLNSDSTYEVLRFQQLPRLYLNLSKARLTALVAASALCGYSMAPGKLELTTCFLMTIGTFMTSCSANAFNQVPLFSHFLKQYYEVPYDSQMARTKQRVLVKGLLSSFHAITFASTIGLGGVLVLALYVNWLASFISVITWALYVTMYTPLKRICIGNTWIGAVVGALPPLIGWAGRTGELTAGAYIIAGFLFTWQFPHFNALSWNLRSDYSRAGYCMMATKNPALCQTVALRHCVFLIVLSTMAPFFDLTTWPFALFSLPLNFGFAYLGWCFYKNADGKTATHLFKFSLFHLPLLMLMLLISKKKVVLYEEVY